MLTPPMFIVMFAKCITKQNNIQGILVDILLGANRATHLLATHAE